MSEVCSPPTSILLFGELGSGKTAFAKLFIENLLFDGSQKVTSPTFNIIQIYATIRGDIWHADLYRLKKEAELEELGLIEAMHENICLIEWPEIILPFVKDNNNIIEVHL